MTFRLIPAWLVLGAALSLPAAAGLLQMGTTAAGPAPPVNTGAPSLTVVTPAITLANSAASQSSGTAGSQATTINGTTAGNLLTAEVSYYGSTTTITVTATGGVTCTLSPGTFATSTPVSGVGIYYCLGSPGGNVTITATLGVTEGYITVSVQEWAGALTTSAVDAGLGAACGGSFTQIDCFLTPTQNGALVISAVATNASADPTSVGGATFTDSYKKAAYSLTSTNGTMLHHLWNFSPAGTQGVASVTAFKHP